MATLTAMLEADASLLCSAGHGRSLEPTGHRWDQTKDKINFHGGQVSVERQRLRSQGGGEVPLPS